MSVRKHLIHVKSNQLMTGSTTEPKAPESEVISYGEIAINYRKDKERIFIKNSDDEIVAFYSGKVIDENEAVTAHALLDLDGRINDIEETNVNLENMESVTYSELKSKMDNGGLVPGKHYRITDYVATTVQENTQSAGHQFDVVVLALDERTLSENAHAMLHDGDIYFSTNNADLSAWELKYCLDNDTDRFAWADSVNGKGVIYYMKDELNNECPYDFKNIQFKRWAVTDVENTKLSENALTELKHTFKYDEQSGDFSTRYALYNNSTVQISDTTFIVDANNSEWYYTFSTIKQENESFDFSNIEDASIKGNNFYNDEDGAGCFGNIIKPYFNNMASDDDGIDGSQYLNNIVFNGYYQTSDWGYAYHAFANSIGYNSHNNTFGKNVRRNTFVNAVQNNTFGDGFDSNTFVGTASSNIFGYCWYNTFGDGCNSNTFGNECYNNSFGDGCNSNTFGNECFNNSFGDNFQNNAFGDSCSSNTFGNNFQNNAFGDSCSSNTFGNSCSSNTFGDNCLNNSFGNAVKHVAFSKNYIYYVIVENGNQYITLTSTQTPTNSTPLRNITIAQGVNNTETNKTISHNTLNDTFKTTYQSTNSVVVNT